MDQETEIRPGSLIIESSYIFSNPNNRYSVKSYGIVLSIDKILGIEIFWFMYTYIVVAVLLSIYFSGYDTWRTLQ